jgi:hypothetical protein
MTDPAAQLRTRTIGRLYSEATEADITVEHVYLPDGSFSCDDCGNPGHDPGMVGLMIDAGVENNASVLLSPEEALLLINRLQRAVSLVLESGEEVPDIEREAARFGASVTEGEKP